MSFNISIKNNGSTSTIQVYQKLNLNEEQEIFNGVIENGKSKQATAFSTEENSDNGGEFAWTHVGSSMTGQEFVAAGGELIVDD